MKKLFISAALLIVSIAPSFAQDKTKCHGKTQAGKECSRNAKQGKEFCFQHNPAGNHCGVTTKSGAPCKVAVKNAGDKCFHHKTKA